MYEEKIKKENIKKQKRIFDDDSNIFSDSIKVEPN